MTAGVGPLLRRWRERRRMSQLDLAIAADSSARHLSFVENGRSRPSQAMVMKLAEHLEVPVRQRNELLVAAGYAPVYSELPVDAPELTAVRAGIDRLLRAYAPFPALVFDGTYTVIAANDAVTDILLDGVAPHLLTPPLNVLRISLHPDGLAPRVVNADLWRKHLIDRLERQLSWSDNPALRALFDEVSAYPAVPGVAGTAAPDLDTIAQPLQLVRRGEILSFITTATTFNTPLDVTVSELAIEAFIPADAATERALASSRP
ncbi:helix-turn-helix transcriptional regulator [Actinokineospora sp. HUAS TT18]|uniref:helix-turn-helix transcriptional regulator n=1 Tax=Actinokineospora sp. HUAS TT18 TaxID=3447451 RepID=UPI003F526758